MRFLVHTKNNPNDEVVRLFKRYKENLSYNDIMALYCDFFFILYDEKDVIAECSVSIENEGVIEINDVFVYERFRGKRYSELLILNVLYHFAGKKETTMVKICCELHNIPAYQCYKKMFGLPYRSDSRYAYFFLVV